MPHNYPITLERAKQVAKIRLGHLPRPGCSVVVRGVWITDNPIYPQYGTCYYQLELVNSAGRFYLNGWTKPCVYVDMTKFETIEYKRDSRYSKESMP